MKKLPFFILFLLILGCSYIDKNRQTSINFNCPRLFFSSEDRIFIDNSNSLDNVLLKAELNNFQINTECQQKDKIVIIPLDLLIIAKPMDDLVNPEIIKYINRLSDYLFVAGRWVTETLGETETLWQPGKSKPDWNWK